MTDSKKTDIPFSTEALKNFAINRILATKAVQKAVEENIRLGLQKPQHNS